MEKRLSIRLVPKLRGYLNEIAKERGLSLNSLITEMAWSFIEEYQAKKKAR